MAELRSWSPQGGSNDWYAESNWTPSGTPQLHDDVSIDLAFPAASLASGDSVALNSLTLASGGRLFTGGRQLTVDNVEEDATARAIGTGSILVIDSGAPTGADARVDILELLTSGEAKLNGGLLEIDSHLFVGAVSRITGNGTVRLSQANLADSPSITIGGTLRPSGGRGLFVSAPEGAEVTIGSNAYLAHLDAGFGDLTIDSLIDDRVRAVLTIGSGRTISFEQEAALDAEAIINLRGSATSQATLVSEKGVVWGRINIDRLAGLSGAHQLRETSEIHLPDATDRLILRGETAVIGEDLTTATPGAQFIGQGVVVNGEHAELMLLSAPRFDAEFVNSGIIDLGYIAFTTLVDVGKVNFSDFSQTATGELHYDIGHTGGELLSDQYRATGAIALDGLLKVNLVELPQGETPTLSVGDSFAILSAAGGVTGRFSETILPAPPTGATWELLYFQEAVSLNLVATTGLSGDYNNDGAVDAADYTDWRDNLGQPVHTLPNATGAGAISSAHYSDWRANYGAVAASMAQGVADGTIPEPLAASLLFASVFAATLLKPRKQRA